ncbi:hypothetical protein BH10PSE3_BH10PSE3_04880 [soil metagenome]
MTPDAFATLAAGLAPNVQVRPILDATQFRLGGKAFATLGWPGEGWAVIKLDPADQAWALRLSRGLAPEPSRRARPGVVLARLKAVDEDVAAMVLAAAWRRAVSDAQPKPRSRTVDAATALRVRAAA